MVSQLNSMPIDNFTKTNTIKAPTGGALEKHHYLVKIAVTIALAFVIILNGHLSELSAQSSTEGERVKYRPSPRVRLVSDVIFATYGARSLRLDLYLPVGRKQAVPGAIVIRGGGWMVNDRAEFAHVASALAERGVAAASIEYRTADEAPFPAALQDVKAAIRWMRANAGVHGISPDAIGTLGGSSGAHMALLAGLTVNERDFEGAGGHNNVSSRVQAVVAMATPADLSQLSSGGQRTVARFLNATLAQNPKLWARASPVNHIRAGAPPVLLMHSSTDEAVLPEQSSQFAKLYRKAGAKAELVFIEKAHHAFWNYRLWFDDAMDRAAAFFLRVANHE
jgi:acetyl esterase/lipase